MTEATTTVSHSPDSTPAKRLFAAAKANNWAEFEELWLDLPNQSPRPDGDVKAVAQEIVKRKSEEDLLGYVELLIDQEFPEESRRPGLRWVLICLQHSAAADGLREKLTEFTKAAVPGDQGAALVTACGIEGDTPLSQVIDTLESLLHLEEKAVYHHEFYGPGVITNVDFGEQRLTMDFPGTAHSGIPVKFEHIKKLLKELPEGHFDSMRLRCPDEVKKLGSDDPGKLVRLVAASRNGKIVQADLKSALTANVYSDSEFKSWWGKRRAEVVRDPLIDIEGKGARAIFRVRVEEKPYHEEVVRSFVIAKAMSDRLDAVREILRMARDNVFPTECFDGLLNPFRQAKLEADKVAASERIGWELLRQLLLSVAPDGFEIPYSCDVAAELKAAARPVETLAALQIPEFVMGCFPDVKEAFPKEWPKVLHDLGEISKPRIVGRIIDLLNAEGKNGVAADMLGRIISFPERNPDAYLWAMSGLLDGTLSEVSVGLDRHHHIEDLLTQLEAMGRPPLSGSTMEEKDRRALANGISKILSERQHQHVAAMLVEMDVEEAREFYRGLEKRKLEESFVGQLRGSLRKSRNDLEEERNVDPTEYLDAVLMCTQASYDAKMGEFRHLKSVEIPANSKAIGAAAELGDLRENSEYQTAKEHQKVLFRRVEELDIQLHKARVIGSDRVTTKAIDFGTRFTVKGADGMERTLTMMGPWESDPDNGVISYQAPLGKAFYKKAVGDKVTVERPGDEPRVEEVVSIDKAM